MIHPREKMTRPAWRMGMLAGIVILQGCLGPKTIMEYREHALLFEVPAPPSPGNLPWTVGVRPVTAGKTADQRMAYVDADGVLRRYADDGWAEPPATAVYRGLVDALRETGAFADVDNAADMVRPDILVTGELRECAADFSASPPVARVTLAISARVYRDRSQALGRVITRTVKLADASDNPMQEISPLRVAQALRLALRDAVADAAGLIVEHCKEWAAKTAAAETRETGT
ncbi:MAG TPA: ABC-type transport auxiliary lipoprotein family protein [Candidatus Hydrogenedentes bacterium]|nr:ABC-type transport auxiliary lipoprotein family protein [Candidatus Hydrogenedentota bacterium]